MWYSFKPEKDLAEEFNLSSKLQALLKAYNKALSDGQAIKATPDEIQVLESLAAALRVQPCILGGLDVLFEFNCSLDVLLNTQCSGKRFQHLNFIRCSPDGLAV